MLVILSFAIFVTSIDFAKVIVAFTYINSSSCIYLETLDSLVIDSFNFTTIVVNVTIVIIISFLLI